MHEMSIAESVLQIIEDKAQADGYARVKTVWLEIGRWLAWKPSRCASVSMW